MKMFTRAHQRTVSRSRPSAGLPGAGLPGAGLLIAGLLVSGLLSGCAPRVSAEPDSVGATFDPGPTYTAALVLPTSCADALARVRQLGASLRPSGPWNAYTVASSSDAFLTFKAEIPGGTGGAVTSSVWMCGQDRSLANGDSSDSSVLRVSTLGLDQAAARQLHDAFFSELGGG